MLSKGLEGLMGPLQRQLEEVGKAAKARAEQAWEYRVERYKADGETWDDQDARMEGFLNNMGAARWELIEIRMGGVLPDGRTVPATYIFKRPVMDDGDRS